MKWLARLICAVLLLTCLGSGMAVATAGGAASVTENGFPEGVIVVPMGTEISINDDAGTVSITACPVEIREGDTFVVYLQDLPLGYVAEAVTQWEGRTVVRAHKADRSLFIGIEEQGVVELDETNSEFIPAPQLRRGESGVIQGDLFDYKDGTVTITLHLDENSTAKVKLKNLKLNHSASGGALSASLSGNWSVTTEMKLINETLTLADMTLGEVRIYGVGKIALNLSVKVGVGVVVNLEGDFEAGFDIDSSGNIGQVRSFHVTKTSLTGQAECTVSLKVTAGIDILVAEADIFAEIGVKWQMTLKDTYHEDTNKSVHCEDHRFFLYLKVGAEAKYMSLLGVKKTLACKDFYKIDESNTPFFIGKHYENGVLVNECTEGMVIPTNKEEGYVRDFGSTLNNSTTRRFRALYGDTKLGWDTGVDGDYSIESGTLDLNGKILTIEGDLIQSGGKITVGNGTLIVKGDYRIQSYENGVYGDSDGALNMNDAEGLVDIDGDFVVQTTSKDNSLRSGTIKVGGGVYQKNAGNTTANCQLLAPVTMKGSGPHTIGFEDSVNNYLSTLSIEGDTTVQGDLRLNINRNLSLNGNTMLVTGDMINGAITDLSDGKLAVNGNLHQFGGELYVNGGKVEVGGGFYLVGRDSSYEGGKEHYTSTTAKIKMLYDPDEIRVSGDVVLYGYGLQMEKGTLYVGGNFSSLGAMGTCDMGKDHRTVLNGEERQIIRFVNYWNNGFGTLQATNTDLVFEDNVAWMKLDSDITATSNGVILGRCWSNGTSEVIRLSGKQVTLNGDVYVEKGIDLEDGQLTINGDLHHTDSLILVNGGKLTIEGNYYLAGKDSSFASGKERYVGSSAALQMCYPADEVRVSKDFIVYGTTLGGNCMKLEAGTLYVSGNLNGSTIYAKEAHKTVLNGADPQKVTFTNSGNTFGTLNSTNTDLVFDKYMGWVKQDGDLAVTSEGAVISSKTNLNGNSLTITGDVRLNADLDLSGGQLTVKGNLHQSASTLSVNGGKANVTGGYYMVGADSRLDPDNPNYTRCDTWLKMTDPRDEVRVGSDFVIYTTRFNTNLTAGTMYVGGDFTQLDAGTRYSFGASKDHRVVLDGTGIQTATFGSEDSQFSTLELPRPMNRYVFSPNPCWLKLVQSTNLDGALYMPAGMTTIDEEAFAGNEAVRFVLFPEDAMIERIESQAFKGCASLGEVEIPASVTYIAPDAFEGCGEKLTLFVYSDYGESYAEENGLEYHRID